jgi:hypothetical protein
MQHDIAQDSSVQQYRRSPNAPNQKVLTNS